MGGLGRRIERLEDLAGGIPASWGPWPAKEQLTAVLDHLDFNITFGTVASCTDRELRLISAAFSGEVPDEVSQHTRRMDPKHQEERDRREYEARGDFLPWRERVRQEEERHRAYAEESRRRDRAMLEENRRACGLSPLGDA